MILGGARLVGIGEGPLHSNRHSFTVGSVSVSMSGPWASIEPAPNILSFLMFVSRTPSAEPPETRSVSMRRRISTCLSGTLPGFTPLVYSVDRVAGRETKQAERRLASQLAWKWKREYSEMVGHMRTMMTLAVVRSNSILMCGSMVRRSYARPSVDEGAAVFWGQRHWRKHC